MMDPDGGGADICRICRSEGLSDRPLFHPCICTGSIKWIHQECLVQWMRYSRKEYCELCGYRFSFTPIYSPDMPRRLPLKDLAGGLLSSVITAVKYWLHYTLVAIAWLGIVPLTACRIYRALFAGTVDAILTIPFDMLSTENLASDIFHGCFVVVCTLFAFVGLIWLREQILHGGGLDWLQRENPVVPEAGVVPAVGNNNIPEENVDVPEANNVVEQPPNIENGAHPENPMEHQDLLPPGDPNAAGEDNNWIPMEWDRAAEELTWERLLGLDGSLVFLEHVFWVVSLNSLFILIFAFCPYHMGLMALNILNLRDTAAASHFEGLLTTLVGYCLVGMILVVLHRIAAFLGLVKAQRVLGICYVVVKVSMLSVVEIGILPLVCGWWLDICSLAMFDVTLKDRETSFRSAPGTSIFIHWLVGMVYVYYFASFVLLLREILRPGVLWFLRNMNDPDFSPIQEMIHLPILRHVRRLLLSAVIFGSAVLLMLWLPIRILRMLWPSFLPYTVTLNTEAQFNELSLELLLLQVIIPALLEQSHTRTWLKGLIRSWCKAVAWLLDLHSYLLGEGDGQQTAEDQREGEAPAAPVQQPEAAGGLGAAHQAFLMMEGPTGFQPYERPSFFCARLVTLLVAICISLVISSLVALTLPVWLGRRVMALWLVGAPPPGGPQIASTAAQTEVKFHELYTAACGTYLCWLAARAAALLLSWLPQGRTAMMEKLKHWCILGAKTIVASTILLVSKNTPVTMRRTSRIVPGAAVPHWFEWAFMGSYNSITRATLAPTIAVDTNGTTNGVACGVIPLLFGLLLELVVIVPFRVPIHQTPVLFMWQDWALGVLYTKIACAITMMGPDWFFRTAIERAYRDGIYDMQLSFIVKELALPVIVSFGLALAVPYVVTYSIVPIFVTSVQLRNLIARRLYPFLLLIAVGAVVITLQIRQFKKLYEHIKNDKYLVEQRLVNYDHRRVKTQNAPARS